MKLYSWLYVTRQCKWFPKRGWCGISLAMFGNLNGCCPACDPWIILLSNIKQTTSQNAYILDGRLAGNQRDLLSNFVQLSSSMKLDPGPIVDAPFYKHVVIVDILLSSISADRLEFVFRPSFLTGVISKLHRQSSSANFDSNMAPILTTFAILQYLACVIIICRMTIVTAIPGKSWVDYI